MEHITYTSVPQAEFDRQTSLIGMVFKLFVHGFIFLPLLITGYWVSRFPVLLHASFLVRGAIILLVAAVIYAVLLRVKAWIIMAKASQNWLWLPVFLICCAYTCLAIPLIFHQPLTHLFMRWHWPGYTAYLADAVIACLVYSRYDFLGWF